MTPAVDAFVRAHSRPSPSWDLDALDPIVREQHDRGCQAWPNLKVSLLRFAEHLGAVVPAQDDPVVTVPRLRADDLVLAVACLDGQPRALAAFRTLFVADVRRVLLRMGISEADVDDLEQEILDRALTPADGKPPKLAGYGGRGPLGRWLRSIAVRSGVRRIPRRGEAADDANLVDKIADDADGAADPAIDLLKRQYRAALGETIGTVLQTLDPADRLLLRQYFVDGLTIDQLAQIHGIHRSTAARRVARVRRTVRDGTHAALVERLGVDAAEARSLARLVHSQLELSVSRLLRPDPPSD